MRELLIAAALLIPGSVSADAPQQTQQPQNTPQQQTIPDAPKPQVPGIGPVTPGKGAASSSSGAPAAADDGFQKPVTDKLSDPTVADVDPGGAPDLDATPIGGEGLAAPYRLTLGVNYVEVPFTVKDKKGALVAGLTWRDVRVYENNVRQHLRRFIVDPIPMSMAVVIDQSLPTDVESKVNNALGALQSAFASYDEVAVFTYSNGPHEITNFTAGTSDRLVAAVERAKSPGRETMYYAPGEALNGYSGIQINGHAQDDITPLSAGGSSVQGGVSHNQVPREVHTLNDAILAAAKATTKAGPGRRRIVYVISDGKEYGSVAKSKEVIKYLQQNKVEVFATLVGDASVEGMGFLDHIHIPLMMRDNILPVYANATGGQVYAEWRQKAIERSFSAITEAVRNQYVIGYNSHEQFIDGKYRKIEVKVLRPNLSVIAKDGYYPTPEDTTTHAQAPPATTSQP